MTETKVSAKCFICNVDITVSTNESIIACDKCKSLENASRGDMANKHYMQEEQKKIGEFMAMMQLQYSLDQVIANGYQVSFNDDGSIDIDNKPTTNENEEEKTMDHSSSSNI
jgi:hypothetical protein